MREDSARAIQETLQPLRELTWRAGSDPLLTQGSTGNSSLKRNGVLWIKASGKWMASALREDILVPLDLAGVRQCLRQQTEPAERYPDASLETALHAAIPQRVVLHVHCVNTIAWAVRRDAPLQLRQRLEGLRWQWIPYTASGLALGSEIARAVWGNPETGVFVLGNHGLVIGGADPAAVEALLAEVRRRLSVSPRQAARADYAGLTALSSGTEWELPADDEIHALGMDPSARAILTRGLLYPCQAVFSNSKTPELFQALPCPVAGEYCRQRYDGRPFLIVEGRGVLVQRTMKPAGLAMLSGLAKVVARVDAGAPIRYLSEDELGGVPEHVAYRYRELANASQGVSG